MHSPWTYALIFIALVIMALSYRVPRAWLWVGCGGVSFFVSTLFMTYVGPDMHPVLTLACDALVCWTVFNYYEEDWELGVFLAYMVSVFSSLMMIGGFINQDWVYASLLEACNLCALLWIGTTGVIDMVGKNEDSIVHSFRQRIRHARSIVQ